MVYLRDTAFSVAWSCAGVQRIPAAQRVVKGGLPYILGRGERVVASIAQKKPIGHCGRSFAADHQGCISRDDRQVKMILNSIRPNRIALIRF
jgi:hypothetical protein